MLGVQRRTQWMNGGIFFRCKATGTHTHTLSWVTHLKIASGPAALAGTSPGRDGQMSRHARDEKEDDCADCQRGPNNFFKARSTANSYYQLLLLLLSLSQPSGDTRTTQTKLEHNTHTRENGTGCGFSRMKSKKKIFNEPVAKPKAISQLMDWHTHSNNRPGPANRRVFFLRPCESSMAFLGYQRFLTLLFFPSTGFHQCKDPLFFKQKTRRASRVPPPPAPLDHAIQPVGCWHVVFTRFPLSSLRHKRGAHKTKKPYTRKTVFFASCFCLTVSNIDRVWKRLTTNIDNVS